MDSPAKRPSLKKKSKKDKKRKSESIAVASPTSPKVINGAKHSASGSSGKNKKRRKEKKKPKRESNGGSADDERGMEREQKAAAADTNESPPSAAEVEQMSLQKQQASIQQQPTSGPGALLSLSSAKSTSLSTSSTLKKGAPKSPYQTKTLVGTAALLPSSVSDVPARINALLHSLLLTYDATLGGVLLSLDENVKLLPVDDGKSGGRDNSGGGLVGGRILDDLPYLHYRFSATGLVFCPTVGMRLKGQVVDCTPTYITLTTHHILSTKIFADRLKEVGFFYSEGSNEWTRERDVRSEGMEEEAGEGALLGPSTSIYLDDSVEFVVDRIHECGGYISLDGARPSVSTLG